MPSIGVIPTKTTLELREPDGDAGTIPAATESAAGCMTAAHVRQLAEVYGRVVSDGMQIAAWHVPDMAGFVTRDDLRMALAAVVKPDPRIAVLEDRIKALSVPPPMPSGAPWVPQDMASLADIERLTRDLQVVVQQVDAMRQILLQLCGKEVVADILAA